MKTKEIFNLAIGIGIRTDFREKSSNGHPEKKKRKNTKNFLQKRILI